MKKMIVASILLLVATMTSLGMAAEEVALHGSLQFWTRHCDHVPSCHPPQPTGPAHAVVGVLAKPPLGTGSYFERLIIDGGLEARLHIFWQNQGANADQHYFAYQVRIIDTPTRTIIAECSGFERDDLTLYFPVGACSGTIRGISVGVTMRKTTPQSAKDN